MCDALRSRVYSHTAPTDKLCVHQDPDQDKAVAKLLLQVQTHLKMRNRTFIRYALQFPLTPDITYMFLNN